MTEAQAWTFMYLFVGVYLTRGYRFQDAHGETFMRFFCMMIWPFFILDFLGPKGARRD